MLNKSIFQHKSLRGAPEVEDRLALALRHGFDFHAVDNGSMGGAAEVGSLEILRWIEVIKISHWNTVLSVELGVVELGGRFPAFEPLEIRAVGLSAAPLLRSQPPGRRSVLRSDGVSGFCSVRPGDFGDGGGRRRVSFSHGNLGPSV
jgi:hypothetical protein